jgi:ubiquinone/menaquinone biosynthesis C-methylase UbiE
VVPRRPSFSEYYERPIHSLLFRWIDLRKVVVTRRALATLSRNATLVDVGAGSGAILARVARAGDLAIAVDRDLTLLDAARRRGLLTVVADFDAPLPFADRSVTAALMIDAIEHTTEPRQALRELHRLLRPGGVAVVFTPPYDSLRWLVAERLHRLITGRAADHISPCTRESLAWALANLFESFTLGRVNWNLTMYGIARKPDDQAGDVTA